MLISTTELAAHLNDRTWVVFDCRHDLVDHAKGARLYREGHVPGAHFAPVETELSGEKTGKNGRHPLPAPERFIGFLAKHGVSTATTIIAYDDSGGLYSARLWWLARWIGLKRVALLDGGIPRWFAENRAVTPEIPQPVPAPLTGEPDPTMIWNAAEVWRRLQRAEGDLIDARAAERYRGEVETLDPVAGHIPGAVNRFYRENLKPDQTFRSPEELRREFAALTRNMNPRNVAHQCGSGVTACANLFAMEYAGLAGSKLYPGSWSEWIADPSRPVARGATP